VTTLGVVVVIPCNVNNEPSDVIVVPTVVDGEVFCKLNITSNLDIDAKSMKDAEYKKDLNCNLSFVRGLN
jgi:hypothetical protein